MDCEIISSENVKPSSPTPQNLRTHKLSVFDQMFPPTLDPIVLYYPNTTEITSDSDLFISQTTQKLKQSLSVILTRYYPLAGRLNSDGQSIDCNDEGIPFVVAKFKGQKLSDLLRNPDLDLPRHLLPCEIKSDSIHVVLIQVSYFDCGGVAVGAFLWHRAVDAVTAATFLQSWASTTRGSKQPVCPNYIIQSMFPQKEEKSKQLGSKEMATGFSSSDIQKKEGKSVIRRYVFDVSAISSLKSKVEGATRVEVVTALLWKCIMVASLANNAAVSLLSQAVNLRRRAEPPFPTECFGNFLGLAVAASRNENDAELGELIRKMRDAISKIDDELINRIRGDEGLSAYYKILFQQSKVPQGVRFDILNISSWIRSGFSDTDFGWGKPSWLTQCLDDSNTQFTNQIWLMDTRNGDGIEAWVTLDEKYMSVLDNVEELRALASVDPCPLDI